MLILDFLLAGAFGYLIKLRATIILLLVYFGCLFLGALAWPELFSRFLNADTILAQTAGMVIGALLRSSKDKSKLDTKPGREKEKVKPPEDGETIKAQAEGEILQAAKEKEAKEALERLRVVGTVVKKQNRKRQ